MPAAAPAAAPVAPAAPPPAAGKPAAPAAVAKPGAAAPIDPAAPAAAPETFMELMVNGKLRKFTKAEAERYVSKGGFADETTQKAKEAIRDAIRLRDELTAKDAARLERAKKDPEAFLKEHGFDPDEFARTRLNKKIEEGKLTPEQREALELKAENQRLKDAQAKAEADQKLAAEKAQTTALQRNIEKTLKDSAARAGIEPGDESFYAIYESFKEAYELGLLPPDGLQPHQADRIIEDAMGRIEGSKQALEKAVLAGLKGEKLLSRLGPAVVKEVLDARIAQIRAGKGGAIAASPAPKPNGTPQVKPSGYMTPAEADAKMKELLRKGGQ